MQILTHPLRTTSAGSHREVRSFHYGSALNSNKVYIQSSLHADEIPGMLVSHYLRLEFDKLEKSGAIPGCVVVVPVANPIGLNQDIQGVAFGRFDLATGLNFNRGYRHLTPGLLQRVQEHLGGDAAENVRLIREHSKALIGEWQTSNQAEELKKTLQGLAIDADIVLDLHCDNQAVLHLYTGAPLAEVGMHLAARLQAHALLVTRLPGDDPFDDSCSRHWWELREHFDQSKPIPLACQSLTVELRGESDVNHETAKADAEAIIAFLRDAGHIAEQLQPTSTLPRALCQATPLEGVEPICAPQSGILVFEKELGAMVEVGESIGDVLDPLSGESMPMRASVSGVLFARVARRYAHQGMRVAKIAGATAYRTGNLLSA